MAMGPESIKYLAKGMLKESDLDYPPEGFRQAIFGSGELKALYQ
jgi:hypothetical protein